ncbi:DUF3105 domain-containing protein [Glycomyces sp. TRM65418]|uniref:DUF3105 domain-containing protein n=1 Tax=Glycomyces sp. TRM65418 TaxID=2867006 RepID=UPI001CE6FC0B|nr:DUF3105 domain-containing protein [Glycomyces sp. TRM65418]MCC3764994.1 DUF3105 domain-containing protein [Glycomyces sp. TRM65418]QZD54626.1 DUF3105 domain-containing protein [Glycomyces sp. TRM65418]
MASKKQTATKGSGKGTGKGAVKSDGKSLSRSATPANARKGRAVQVKQPKPWGLILTFSAVGVVALGLIGAAVYVVWDRSQPPEGVTDFYGEYANYSEVSDALRDGEVTEEELEHPWVVQQTHVDNEDPAAVPEYELTPPAGGNHLGAWQTCSGNVYDAPIVDGNAVHSLEHGAVWLTYDPALVDGNGVKELASKIENRDYSLMSPYPELGVPVSIQAWGVQYQTDDINDPKLEEFLDFYVQNADNTAEANATCSGGVSTTIADQQQMPTG